MEIHVAISPGPEVCFMVRSQNRLFDSIFASQGWSGVDRKPLACEDVLTKVLLFSSLAAFQREWRNIGEIFSSGVLLYTINFLILKTP
jgi:hypothetical protein